MVWEGEREASRGEGTESGPGSWRRGYGGEREDASGSCGLRGERERIVVRCVSWGEARLPDRGRPGIDDAVKIAAA